VNTRSLSVRLVTWYAGVLTIVFVLLGALTVIFLQHYLETALLDTQTRRARQIADTLLAAVGRTGEGVVAREVEDLYSPEANDRFIRITRDNGAIVYVSGTPRDGSFGTANIPAAPHVGKEVLTRKQKLPEGSLLIGAVTYESTTGQKYVVEVGVSSQRTDATLRQVVLFLSIGLPVAVGVAVSGGFLLVRRALIPVERIAQKAEQITQLNLSDRLPVLRTGDELERLSVSLNHMISRLQDSVQASKRFVADASHELRTPLAVLRGELESLAQDAELKARTRESLGSLLEEVDRLAEIVESLLALSRLDAGEARSEWERFDLAELVASTAEQMGLLAEDKSISLLCERSSSVMVEGNRARMKQVVVNLLDNAIKYTPEGGRVLLKVTQDATHAKLEVIDNGVGIPPEALPHMFERFFRVDDSRSREQGGAGLGLSIVKAICAAHGAQVRVTSTVGSGTCFTVQQSLAGARAQ